MSQKSNDLLLYLRQNKSLKYSKIESLIIYGFDWNHSLIALDFGLDFDQMEDIRFGQKWILEEILTQFKINNNNDLNFDNKFGNN